MDRLEKHLKFLVIDSQWNAATAKERLMKVFDITDESVFHSLLTRMRGIADCDLLKELACFVHQQQSRPADQPVSSRRYLTDVATIRAHFSQFKETAVPKKRLDMWKMLARALIQYEMILRGNHQSKLNLKYCLFFLKRKFFLFYLNLFPFDMCDRSIDAGRGYSNTDQIAYSSSLKARQDYFQRNTDGGTFNKMKHTHTMIYARVFNSIIQNGGKG